MFAQYLDARALLVGAGEYEPFEPAGAGAGPGQGLIDLSALRRAAAELRATPDAFAAAHAARRYRRSARRRYRAVVRRRERRLRRHARALRRAA